MAFDTVGATIGGCGHDAVALLALTLDGPISQADAIAQFKAIRADLVADFFEVHAVVSLEQGVSAKEPAGRSYSGGNSGTPSGKPSGGPAGLDTVIRSGKYGPKDGEPGKTVGEVVEIDRDYAEWAAANMKNEFLQKAFVAGLEAVAA